ncbi:MAG: glycosyltransferase family 4 protein [Cyclobacteriaceae bacterium]|nr:glycosyltransferase family 4 protein [Cyclobacteriaceae bacterium]
MSILWLTENYPPQRGGMAQSCDRIVDQLRKLGHTINVLHFTDRGIPFQVTQQLNGWYAVAPFEDSEAHTLNVTWEFVRQKSISAIVCFGGYLPMLAAPVFSKWLSVPLLTLVRGNDFDSAVFTPRKRDMMRDVLEASRVVSVVSKDKIEKIKKLFPHVNVQYVPNGIDIESWNPTPSELAFAETWRKENSEHKVCIGLFGQLKAKKGVRFLFDALRQSEMLERMHFLLIGEVTDETGQLIASNEFSITSCPFLDRYELLKYYLCCDGIAIPSFYDGMPNVLLEAGALGIPVIASNTGGMKDIITDRQNGMVFTPGEALSCRKSFFDFVNLSGDSRAALGAQLKSTIHTQYTVQLETKRYDELIKTWLDSNHTAVRLHAQ